MSRTLTRSDIGSRNFPSDSIPRPVLFTGNSCNSLSSCELERDSIVGTRSAETGTGAGEATAAQSRLVEYLARNGRALVSPRLRLRLILFARLPTLRALLLRRPRLESS
uniref:Uncharacterized protein n=1 Tax=Vespula pensylvanica TaxID=30213 RepID=A0A834U556_VESPE|nr:hypothetical protein H0235_011532 [Vespula pensylvanica]